jgi:dipeptidyl aminopeptidase/acylaminoacyl peptidase
MRKSEWGWIAALALLAAACSPRAPLPQFQSVPAEAAGMPANPASAGSFVTVAWDSAEKALRVEAVHAASGLPATDWTPLVLEESGKNVSGYEYSPNGDQLAVTSGTDLFCSRSAGGSACWAGVETLHVIDLDSGDVKTIEMTPVAYVPALAYSPDGRKLAFARETRQGFEIGTWDIGDESSILTTRIPFLPTLLEYSLSGEELIALGDHPGEDPGMTEPGPLTVAVLDADSLITLWQTTLDIRHGSWCLEGCEDTHEQMRFANWTPAIVRLPETDRIAVVHADSDHLTTIDISQRLVETRPILDSLTWLDRLMAFGTVAAEAKGGSEGVYRQAAASPDGGLLYLIGREMHAWLDADGMMQMSDTGLDLQVIDVATGTRLSTLESEAAFVSLSPDGAWILLRSWSPSGARTQVISSVERSAAEAVEDWDVVAGRSLEGTTILVATSSSSETVRVAQVVRRHWPSAGHGLSAGT